MSKTYLIIDSNYLCHRAKHSVGTLSHKGQPTGVIYGFLMEVIHLREFHRTENLIFCWDYGKNKRKDMYGIYKAHRISEHPTPEEVEEKEAFILQTDLLREKILNQIGFFNQIYQWGFESDDHMAKFAMDIPDEDEGILITNDRDMLQCIRHNVSFNAPGKPKLTLQGFFKEYGITPDKWAHVKALGGCVSDNVMGIKGVGEKTAIKFLLKRLKPNTKAFRRLISPQGQRVFQRNLRIVKLPLKGTKPHRVEADGVTLSRWNTIVVDKLGMKSIKNMRGKNK